MVRKGSGVRVPQRAFSLIACKMAPFGPGDSLGGRFGASCGNVLETSWRLRQGPRLRLGPMSARVVPVNVQVPADAAAPVVADLTVHVIRAAHAWRRDV